MATEANIKYVSYGNGIAMYIVGMFGVPFYDYVCVQTVVILYCYIFVNFLPEISNNKYGILEFQVF